MLFPPTMETPPHIELAEQLGYEYAFVYDSPAFLADPWITLADAAARTSTIVLGISAITPRLRHVVATAGAIATMRAKAPGRFVIVVGTGFTSQLMIGKRPTRWAEVEEYVVALRALLNGEDVEWDGAVIGLRHGATTGVHSGSPVPIWVAAHGPKGYASAERVADGIVTNPTHGSDNVVEHADQTFVLFYGTVLDPDEELGSERVLRAAGPTAAFQLHLGGIGVAGNSPEWVEYTAQLEKFDARSRHLEMHRGHLIEVSELERPLITPNLIRTTTGTGTEEEVRANLTSIERSGVGGVLFGPQGPDIPREMRRFAMAAGLAAAE
ncbi:MAG: LLM class flavin-dependent oxidoreductase [Frankia sp.]